MASSFFQDRSVIQGVMLAGVMLDIPSPDYNCRFAHGHQYAQQVPAPATTMALTHLTLSYQLRMHQVT